MMGSLERVLVLIVAGGIITTLVLPRRQTPAVINAAGNAFRGSLATMMGTGKTV
jgi:hypothetical protein